MELQVVGRMSFMACRGSEIGRQGRKTNINSKYDVEKAATIGDFQKVRITPNLGPCAESPGVRRISA